MGWHRRRIVSGYWLISITFGRGRVDGTTSIGGNSAGAEDRDFPCQRRRGNQRRIRRLHQIASLVGGEPIRSPVVEDQQVGLDQRTEQACEATVTMGEFEIGEQPPVTGPTKRNSAMRRSVSSPLKRSSSDAGRRSRSTGGMNVARAICQNDVAVKLPRHHARQRSTVRRSTPTTCERRSIRDAVTPCRMIATSTTIAPR